MGDSVRENRELDGDGDGVSRSEGSSAGSAHRDFCEDCCGVALAES